MKENKKGITLIVLILTIIIMLILSTISLNAIFGENGIIKNAQVAKVAEEANQAKEDMEIAWMARMSKFEEDIDNGIVDEYYLANLMSDLNNILGDIGRTKGIKYDTQRNAYVVLYENENGTAYEMEINKAGVVNNTTTLATSEEKENALKEYEITESNVGQLVEEYNKSTDIYAFYYENDKILAFSNSNEGISGKTPTKTWSNLNETEKYPFGDPYEGKVVQTGEVDFRFKPKYPWQMGYNSEGLKNIINNIVTVNFLNDIYPTNLDYFLANLTSLNAIEDFENLHTERVNSTKFMFYGCYKLNELDLSLFDTSSVADMSFLFCGCASLEELDLSSFDISNVTDMQYMFSDCSLLKEIDLSYSTPLSVIDMSCMFDECSSLEVLDLSTFDIDVVEIEEMLSGTPSDAIIYINTKWDLIDKLDIFGSYTSSENRGFYYKKGSQLEYEIVDGHFGEQVDGGYFLEEDTFIYATDIGYNQYSWS